MKQTRMIFVILALFALAGCYIDGEWDGEIVGTEIYQLEVQQNKQILTFSVTVNTDARAEVAASEGYSAPDELFFWIAPQFQTESGDILYANGDGSPRFYPVARKRVTPGFTSTSVTIDLGAIARDWNLGWLTENRFDGDPPDVWSEPDMSGLYAFAADGYRQSYESWVEADLGIPGLDFTFESSVPAGDGVSNVRHFPDSEEGESWQSFQLLTEGLYSPYEVRGGEEFEIVLQLPEGRSFESWESVMITGPSGSFQLAESDRDDDGSMPQTLRWRVKFGADTTDPDPDPAVTYVGNATAESFYSVQFDWYYLDILYLGQSTVLFATDFDGNDVGITGELGSNASGMLELSSVNFGYFQDYYPYDWVEVTVDSTENNWKIGSLAGRDDLDPGDFFVPGNVLGTGTGSVTDYYAPLRNDYVTFPAYDFHTARVDAPMASLVLFFDARREFDYDGNDRVIVQIERVDTDGNTIGWDDLRYFEGSLEYWEREEHNGWRTERIDIGWAIDAKPQRVRFRFQSNDYNEFQGLLVDNFEAALLE